MQQKPDAIYVNTYRQQHYDARVYVCVWYTCSVAGTGVRGFDEAEAKLADKPDGTFLVRDSSDDRYILSLSFRSLGSTHHTRIEHYKGSSSLLSFLSVIHSLGTFHGAIAVPSVTRCRCCCCCCCRGHRCAGGARHYR